MDSTSKDGETLGSAEVFNFDDAMLDACPADLRADLLAEAAMLAQAFAPEGDPAHLTAMAQALSSGQRDSEMDRSHARRLAAALRHLAGRSQT
ncbi:MAG: hypothetical protein JWQ29_433 [Phenylobacterium sp.]|nr:hypothetical protein [Phenylobacterium sp.]